MAGTYNTNAYLTRRPLVLGLAKVLFLGLSQVPIIQAAPLSVASLLLHESDESPKPASDPTLWVDLGVSLFLVLAGGVFAGLTIALMGQDEIYLQVIRDSGEGTEVKHSAKVLNLLSKGKHWVLVTLLLSNVITNETLPIVLDRSLGGGWPAVLASTVLIVIFGEVVPQSVCVRYGLPIGAFMAPIVLTLMYIMAPVAWPTAKLLDYLLGKDHGTMYKKAGLKTLVSLHRNLGEAGQRLHADEVTIISAVLDLKEKPIGSIMTPMDDVFTLSLDDVLDEPTMDNILSQGYSRVPIHHPDNDENFVGMLLVKMLITYDPEDAKPVRDFALATLPETRPDTSCLDIVNFFQEGKSHMVLVSNHPGEDNGGIGVVTLEDVIEELIGEEIVDESDVFVDVHKAIRRMAPAPRNRFPRMMTGVTPRASNVDLIDISENEALESKDLWYLSENENGVVKDARRISGVSMNAPPPRLSSKGVNLAEMKEQLKHIGPSNRASQPKTTKYASVKIKPGSDAGDMGLRRSTSMDYERRTPARRISESASDYGGGIGEGLVSSGGKAASDAVQAIATGYGALTIPDGRPSTSNQDGEQTARPDGRSSPKEQTRLIDSIGLDRQSHDTIGELPDRGLPSKSPIYKLSGPARSGSITENIVDTNGIRKVVLETTSSSESSDEADATSKSRRKSTKGSSDDSQFLKPNGNNGDGNADTDHSTASKKKRRRRKKNTSRHMPESEPLLH